jgi:hypothetical protein
MMKLGVKNFMLVGVMAIVFIVLAKVVLTKYPITGLSAIVQTA